MAAITAETKIPDFSDTMVGLQFPYHDVVYYYGRTYAPLLFAMAPSRGCQTVDR